MTSNLGSGAIIDAVGDDEDTMRAKVQEAIGGFFRPELINRIDEVVIFNRLDQDAITKIVGIHVRELALRLQLQGHRWRLVMVPHSFWFGRDTIPLLGHGRSRGLCANSEDPLSLKLIAGDFKEQEVFECSRMEIQG